MNYRIILIFMAFLAFGESQGQQQVLFTQYLYNMLPLNPAYAGSHESLSVTALAREQWTGIDGAPSTQTLSIHSPIPNRNMGLGLTVIHDKIGITDQTGLYGAYAYQLPLGNGAKLSLGLQAGATFYRTDFTRVDPEDAAFMNSVSEMQPNAGFGLWYSTDTYFAGLSAPQLIESKLDKNSIDSDSHLTRHYFAVAGYVFNINSGLKLKPTVLIKYVDGAPLQLDLSANVLLKDVLGFGLSYRSFDSFDGLIQFQLTDQLQLGYSYDFVTTTELSRVNSGSHELMVNYRFSFNKSNIITPRYF